MFSFITNTLFSNTPEKVCVDVCFLVDRLRPMYEFGTTDAHQLAVNNFLLHDIKKRNLKNITQTYLFSNTKKQIRRAKRTAMFLSDTSYKDRHMCTICHENNSCILLKPCNHAGLCNSCSSKLFNNAMYKQINHSLIASSVYPDPRFTLISESIEDDLHQIQLSLQLCPWCKTRVNSIEYIYIM